MMSVIIVGGGMVGSTLALAVAFLTRGQIPIRLIEAFVPDQNTSSSDDKRAIVLAHGTCQQIERLGIWKLLSHDATPIKNIHVSDQGQCGFVHLRAQDHHIPFLGQVLSLKTAQNRLFSLLKSTPSIQLYCPAQVLQISRTQKMVRVTLNHGETLEAPLLIAADGSHSSLAQACHIQYQKKDYQQFAVTTYIRTEKALGNCAFERFTSEGPLALLPISQEESALIWCHSQANRFLVEAWNEADFLQQLQNTFGWRLGKILKIGPRYSTPLYLTYASRHISHRLALVGNSAQTLHPVAGQGFNLGLRDTMTLAQILAEAAAKGDDLGEYSLLNKYQRQRQKDQQNMITLTEGLVHLFSNALKPLVMARHLGLMTMEEGPFFSHLLSRLTLGWSHPRD